AKRACSYGFSAVWVFFVAVVGTRAVSRQKMNDTLPATVPTTRLLASRIGIRPPTASFAMMLSSNQPTQIGL
ncbi:MAG TPA: hypothetical protein VNC42_08240, partial [Bradyrhizobium sp.]|nr:hypothetical protein [Bradyrhizobium sp.]